VLTWSLVGGGLVEEFWAGACWGVLEMGGDAVMVAVVFSTVEGGTVARLAAAMAAAREELGGSQMLRAGMWQVTWGQRSGPGCYWVETYPWGWPVEV